MNRRSTLFLTTLISLLAVGTSRADPLPAGVVELSEIDPSIAVDMIYFSPVNFVGRPIDGYRSNGCFLTTAAAESLRTAQRRLRSARPELTLLVRDCYRPRKAVRHFLEWARRPDELEMKEMFYPDLSKRQIIEQGFVAPVSAHSRASTVDLTIGRRDNSGSLESIPMGTRVDFFGERSRVDFPGISGEERANRRLLVDVLGPDFRSYSKEWWHFTLKNEPYPKTYFDFDVEKPSLPRSRALGTF